MSQVDLHVALQEYRERAELTVTEVTDRLVVAPGWVEAWERGDIEPPLGILNQLVATYGSTLRDFFTDVRFDADRLAFERQLAIESAGRTSLRLTFPFGSHRAVVVWKHATERQATALLKRMRNVLCQRGKTEAVAETFTQAASLWPRVNPSDIWYFFISHAYQDKYNHPIREANRDLSQSWKRTGGWAFERIVTKHYDAFLRSHDVWLEIPDKERKRKLLSPMGLTNFQAAMEKADVLAVGRKGGKEACFGVIHAKASLAERRTDDAPLSQELIRRNFVSPLVTMDCKATPSDSPKNRGEFGDVQGSARVSEKRLDVERHNIFDAAFSYNANTIPTPEGTPAAARIHVVDFSETGDAFARHVVNKWRALHGASPI